MAVMSGVARGQPAPAAPPAGAADPGDAPTPTETPTSGLRVHVLTSRNTYVPMSFDVFSVDTRSVVASITIVIISDAAFAIAFSDVGMSVF